MRTRSTGVTKEKAQNKGKNTLPKKFSPLFWDTYRSDIDLEEHAPFVMERILEHGTWESVLWLREYYGDEAIKQYILKRGYKVLSSKTLNYWKNTLPISRYLWKKLSLQKNSVLPWR